MKREKGCEEVSVRVRSPKNVEEVMCELWRNMALDNFL